MLFKILEPGYSINAFSFSVYAKIFPFPMQFSYIDNKSGQKWKNEILKNSFTSEKLLLKMSEE